MFGSVRINKVPGNRLPYLPMNDRTLSESDRLWRSFVPPAGEKLVLKGSSITVDMIILYRYLCITCQWKRSSLTVHMIVLYLCITCHWKGSSRTVYVILLFLCITCQWKGSSRTVYVTCQWKGSSRTVDMIVLYVLPASGKDRLRQVLRSTEPEDRSWYLVRKWKAFYLPSKDNQMIVESFLNVVL